MHALATNDHNVPEITAVPLRAHTIFGVCEALGEDFGINPLWLRVPFAASVLISPIYSVAAYCALGLVVLATRLIFPARRRLVAAPVAPAAAVVTNNQEKAAELQLAA